MNTSFGTSNKFAVLQLQPQQPRPKGDKLVASISGPVPNVPAKQLKEQSVSEKDKQTNDNRNNNNNNRRGGENRGRGGSRGASRGGRGGSTRVDRATLDKVRDPDQPPKRNKRIYDKNSNVPKNDSKKSGGGVGNWGDAKNDPIRGADDAKKELVEGEPSSEVKVEEQPVVEQEPEDKTITFKEYQEQRAALAPKIDAPKRREAGEGEKSDLHKYVVLKKEDDEEEKLVIKAKKEKAKKQPKKQTIALSDLHVNSGEDRRGPRKFNNNNSNYNKKPKKVNLPIEDTDSFPALK